MSGIDIPLPNQNEHYMKGRTEIVKIFITKENMHKLFCEDVIRLINFIIKS